MQDKLLDLIQKSQRILITAHISPDPDAVSSVILLNETLKLNFPDKDIIAILEDRPSGLDFLQGFDVLKFDPVYDELMARKPDLFILLDGNNYERCSRHDGDKIRQFLRQSGAKTMIIDHHEVAGKDEADIFINNGSAATAQEVYGLIKNLRLKMPKTAAELALAGFYADTGGFVYVKAGTQKELFGFAEELVSAGADIESIKNRLESYTEDDMIVLGELAKNISHAHDYTFSFMTDDFIDRWAKRGREYMDLQRPTNTFLNSYVRNIGGRSWGFIVYKNLAQGDNIYSASFRSQGGKPDVAAIAFKLGGGGHKPAAGAKFQAQNLAEALRIVQATIEA